jgi:hypothetical protein
MTPTDRDISLFLARHPSETDKDWAYLVGLVAKERDDLRAAIVKSMTLDAIAAHKLLRAALAGPDR